MRGGGADSPDAAAELSVGGANAEGGVVAGAAAFPVGGTDAAAPGVGVGGLCCPAAGGSCCPAAGGFVDGDVSPCPHARVAGNAAMITAASAAETSETRA